VEATVWLSSSESAATVAWRSASPEAEFTTVPAIRYVALGDAERGWACGWAGMPSRIAKRKKAAGKIALRRRVCEIPPLPQRTALSVALKGQDFSRATNAAESARASRAPEKLIPAWICDRFVSGHDFSRAASVAKSAWALAPEGCSLPAPPRIPFFSAA